MSKERELSRGVAVRVDKKYNKLASVESFDPESGVWSEEPPMLTAR